MFIVKKYIKIQYFTNIFLNTQIERLFKKKIQIVYIIEMLIFKNKSCSKLNLYHKYWIGIRVYNVKQNTDTKLSLKQQQNKN